MTLQIQKVKVCETEITNKTSQTIVAKTFPNTDPTKKASLS